MTKKTSTDKRAHIAEPHDLSKIPKALREEYAQKEALFEAQTPITQRFLEAQAQTLADALINRATQARFTLPAEIVASLSSADAAAVPQNMREQMAGGLLDGLMHTDVRTALRHRLLELEGASDLGVAASATLIRHATASYLVRNVLPSGRAVRYAAAEDEEIPSVPVGSENEVESAITAETDAVAESGPADEKRGELLVPFVPAARRFYLPQWVAFDDDGNLLLGSVHEAEAHIASMQHFASVLHMAVGLAPYIVADEEYQRKRYGILGQLVNQGRALARYQTGQIIETISTRGVTGHFYRGLSQIGRA